MSTNDYAWCHARSNESATARGQVPAWHGTCASLTVHNQFLLLGFNGMDLVTSLSQLMVTIATVVYVARNRVQARHDPTHGARLVLPMYERFLYMYTVVTALAMCVDMLQSPNIGQGPINNWLCATFTPYSVAVAIGLDWGMFHFVLEGLTFFLMEKGAGARALRRALGRSILIGICLFFVGFCSELLKIPGSQTSWSDESEVEVAHALQNLMSVGLLLFYAVIRFSPSTLFFRRPALQMYSTFWITYRSVFTFAYVLRQLEVDATFCCMRLAQTVIFDWCSPLAVYFTLRQDSEYWRGHAKAGGGPSNAGHANLNKPLAGRVSLNTGAAAALAETLDTIRTESGVALLNFAYLDMEVGGRLQVVGAGGTAKVYKGSYKGELVAVKLVYPPELTQQDVTGFLAEAAVLAQAGDHPNLVRTLGVCVMPPSIALVLEFCERGDLCSHLQSCRTEGRLDGLKHQAQMACDCVAGVAHLHAHLPRPIVHNDLKSFNVLVTAKTGAIDQPFVAKIADLELGQSRTDGDTAAPGGGLCCHRGRATLVDVEDGEETPPPIPDTVNWTAPELLSGAEVWPSTTSDVWALGMLLFEIFALDIPLSECQCVADLAALNEQQPGLADESPPLEPRDEQLSNPLPPPIHYARQQASVAVQQHRYGREYLIDRLCECSAEREPLRPPTGGGATYQPIPEALVPVLERCWAAEPTKRPQAAYINDMLTAFCATLADE